MNQKLQILAFPRTDAEIEKEISGQIIGNMKDGNRETL